MEAEEMTSSLSSPEGYLPEADFLKVLLDLIRKNNKDGTLVVSIVGGAGSGKTTLARQLVKSLEKADTLGTDDYVVGDRAYRRVHLEGGDPIKKYNPVKLNEHIVAIKNLRDDEKVGVPTYDEKTGEAVDAKEYTRQIGKVDYLIVEGDFDFVENPDLLIYFDVPDEVRLNNRIKRDLVTRDANDESGIRKNFELRQRLQHLPHTLPAKERADIIVEVLPDSDGHYLYKVLEKN